MNRRPTQAAAAGGTLPDVMAPGLRVLFVGINPSLYSAAIGHHFGRPGNRFWPAIHLAGYTPRRLDPSEDGLLPDFGCGVTNLAPRATARADELSRQELVEGAALLTATVETYQPACVAFLGVTAYRHGFNRPKAAIGKQRERIGTARLWVLPNPSGLNAHYRLEDLAKLYRQAREDTAA